MIFLLKLHAEVLFIQDHAIVWFNCLSDEIIFIQILAGTILPSLWFYIYTKVHGYYFMLLCKAMTDLRSSLR